MRPGFLTARERDAAADFIRQVEANQRELDRREPPSRDHFPAILTGTDGMGRFSWTEQEFSATGARMNGDRRGTTTWGPAYAVGDGTGPLPTALPVQTWLRRVLGHSDRGPVYEFDWHCACNAYYSGSGSSGSGSIPRLGGCCPNTLSTVLHATISCPGLACFDGDTFVMNGVISGAGILWSGSLPDQGCTTREVTYTFDMSCNGATSSNFIMIINSTLTGAGFGVNACGFGSPTDYVVTSFNCDPFQIVYSGLTLGVAPYPCHVNTAWTLTITE
jgi:hypothetical protein